MGNKCLTIFYIIYSTLSLLILSGFTIGAFSEKDFTMILGGIFFIAIQWGIYYLIRFAIRFLKKKSPKQWPILLSVWIASASFLLWGFICLSWMEYDEAGFSLAQFIIGSVCIIAMLATAVYSIKNLQKHEIKEG